ncbi:MAG: aldo/keto reductase [Lachnospiraceae bacterium]|nr:aldo/keto reductase [Lachnospiraceae bacterium]
MEKTYLQEIEIPPCMIGTWAWGSGANGSKMVFGKTYSEEQLKDTFEKALDMGFTMWDTAEVYGMGNAERILGKCIAGKDDVLISTKHFPQKKFKEGAMEKSLEESCKRLGIKAPDLYWIHLPNNLTQNVEAGIKLLKAGKIKKLGVSNFSLDEIKKADEMLKAAGFRLAAVQNHFSLLSNPKKQSKIIEWCQENKVVFFSYMVLEQGALSGHYDEKRHFPLFSMRGLTFGKSKFKKIRQLLAYEKELAKKYKTDSSQIPVAWAIAKGTVPIIGLTKEKYAIQLAEAIRISLSEEEIRRLEQLAEESGVVIKGSWEP